MAAFGPAVGETGIHPYRFVRIHDESETPVDSLIEAGFTPHKQDRSPYRKLESLIRIHRRGDYERMEWAHGDEKPWHPVFSDRSDAMFVVGYGANRRVEKTKRHESGRKLTERAQRVMGLFNEDYALQPLTA